MLKQAQSKANEGELCMCSLKIDVLNLCNQEMESEVKQITKMINGETRSSSEANKEELCVWCLKIYIKVN